MAPIAPSGRVSAAGENSGWHMHPALGRRGFPCHLLRTFRGFAHTFVLSLIPVLSLAPAGAQTYGTGNLLTEGSPLKIASRAPGTSGTVGLVHLATNPSVPIQLLYTDPWGVRRGSGTTTMNYTGSGTLVTTVNLTSLPGGGVDGSPFAQIGCDQWDGCGAPGHPLQFPVQLSAMSSLIVDYGYTLSGSIAGKRDIDMIWDEWVCNSSTPNGSSDCLEVEMLPYYSFSDGGPTNLITTIALPVTLNRSSSTLLLDEYTWGPGSQNVTYVPHDLPGLASASIRFDMLTLLNQAVRDYGDPSYSWLMGMEAGTEFGASATQSYTFMLKKLEFTQTLAQ
jgi:hypothetical protein